ncbi:MAG: hypothetical protein HYZ57_03470 [Acidobacteria bacterium]|nr:hypothetical protein [Acidobacteriota bacterium]
MRKVFGNDLRLSHGGTRLALKGNNRLDVVDLASGRVQQIYKSPTGSFEMIWALAWNTGDRELLTIWNTGDRELLTIFRVSGNIARMDFVTFPATGGAPLRQPIDKEFRGLTISQDGKYLGTTRVSQRGRKSAVFA